MKIPDIKRAIEILSDIAVKAEEKEASYAIILTESEVKVLTMCLKFVVFRKAYIPNKKDIEELEDLIEEFGRIA